MATLTTLNWNLVETLSSQKAKSGAKTTCTLNPGIVQAVTSEDRPPVGSRPLSLASLLVPQLFVCMNSTLMLYLSVLSFSLLRLNDKD